MKYVVVQLDDGTAIVGVEQTVFLKGGLHKEQTEHTYYKKVATFANVPDAFTLLKECSNPS
jgi:hypothetical protein